LAVQTARLVERHKEVYGSTEGIRVFRAPGRVNLIGEHTDYNSGLVLPIALEYACFVASAPNNAGMLRIRSENNQESRAWPIADVPRQEPSRDWSDYVLGVAVEIHRMGHPLQPVDLLIQSDVPLGAGLSSSAALEVSAALALLRDRSIPPLELARIARRAENNFAGMPCGVMDQYVSVFGQENAAILIDCLTLEHRPVRLPDGIEIAAVNSMVKHELGQSAYRDRVRECGDAVEKIQRRYPNVGSLREIASRELDALEPTIPDAVLRRARHVTSENERVEAFVAACERGDIEEMGRLLVASHRSLQHDYEVSCPELDFLVDAALAIPGVLGARMTGGGFGGCIVALMEHGRYDEFAESISRAYQQQYGREPEVYRCKPSKGAGEVGKES